MMTLYTAIGTYKINTKGFPTVLSEDKEFALDAHELIIWTSLAFRIYTYQELRALYYEKQKDLHIMSELDFDHYLNRLLMRRLIVSGQDYTGIDAFYDLIGHLHVKAIPCGFGVKVISFLKLFVFRKMPFRKAVTIFHSEKLEPMEKHVMSLIRNQTLSTAELILCTENGKKTLKNTAELMDCLYADEHTDCDTIVTDGRVSAARFSVLTAIANLYLKQRIMFQII